MKSYQAKKMLPFTAEDSPSKSSLLLPKGKLKERPPFQNRDPKG